MTYKHTTKVEAAYGKLMASTPNYSLVEHDAEVIESMLRILSDEYVYVDDLPSVGYALMIDKIKDYANKLEAGDL